MLKQEECAALTNLSIICTPGRIRIDTLILGSGVSRISQRGWPKGEPNHPCYYVAAQRKNMGKIKQIKPPSFFIFYEASTFSTAFGLWRFLEALLRGAQIKVRVRARTTGCSYKYPVGEHVILKYMCIRTKLLTPMISVQNC